MNHRPVKVIGVIGVIGSGKSIYLEEFLKNHPNTIMVDFSNGVRNTVRELYFIPEFKNMQEYREWKNGITFIHTHGKEGINIENRHLLTLVGGIGRRFNKSIWITLEMDNLLFKIDELQKENTNEPIYVLADSVRFANEALALRSLALHYKENVQFIFTNYPSEFYEIRDTESEKFAQSFLGNGYRHRQDITKYVEEKIIAREWND